MATEFWLTECDNCGKTTMVCDGKYGDICLFCDESVNKKKIPKKKEEVKMLQNTTEERPAPPAKPKKRKQHRAYWERNKEAIIADYRSMKLVEFYRRWAMSSAAWTKLKLYWEIQGKGTGEPGKPRQLRQPRSSTQAPVANTGKAKLTEHEEYLILVGYQMAVRELRAK